MSAGASVTVPLAERFPYPLEPLMRRLGLPTTADSALALGVDASLLHGWLRSGLSEEMADHLACRAGHHPGEVWPEWWGRAATAAG